MIESRGLISTREGFSIGLLRAGVKYPTIVGIGSDITASVGMDKFAKAYPDRFYSLGIAEQNAISVAAGMAMTGKIPFVASYATFIAMRTLDQIRVSVCYNHLNVKIGGAHAGISVGPDGATHQALEDIAALRALPNMTILSPADATQTEKAVYAAIEQVQGPVYIRYGREAMPDFTSKDADFIVGKSQVLADGTDCVIYATGHLVWEALTASEMLKKKGIHCCIVNLYSIKPIDKQIIEQTARMCKCAVTAEEHQIIGGLYGAVTEILAQHTPIPVFPVGMNNCFGESGKPLELMAKYHMNANAIIEAVEKVIHLK
ncbi:MAG TPA: transketolase C-terminal domain-containing protein [Bacteroidales bacterium]|nr:transketolase C-terminal domain-containing protein [Bacteroidales bacterium]